MDNLLERFLKKLKEEDKYYYDYLDKDQFVFDFSSFLKKLNIQHKIYYIGCAEMDYLSTIPAKEGEIYILPTCWDKHYVVSINNIIYDPWYPKFDLSIEEFVHYICPDYMTFYKEVNN